MVQEEKKSLEDICRMVGTMGLIGQCGIGAVDAEAVNNQDC
jgi:hypothetical protein